MSTSILLLAVGLSRVHADVQLPAIIGDNMVLQQGSKVPIWGTAEPGENVRVSVGSQTESTTGDKDGRWRVTLNPLTKPGPIDVRIEGNNSIALENVLVGEVWICSGQSNMQWPVKLSNDSENEIASANHAEIRLFQAKMVVCAEPASDTEGEWVVCSPESVPDFSAVGYFFGRELQKMTQTPVGMVQTAWGGTPAEAWTSAKMLRTDEDFQPILDRWEYILNNQPTLLEEYEQRLAEWKPKAEAAKAAGERAPRKPRLPKGPDHPHRASGLFNGMISPLVPFAIKGAIWYQGESNARRAYQYRKLFAAMIRDWRKAWKQGDFPFLFVQLANFKKRVDEPGESDWAELREAQSMALALPNAGQAVVIDIGEADDIHPRNKQDVGRRLALNAAAIAYGRDLVYSGPTYASMQPQGGKIRLKFDHVGGGLIAKGAETLRGFAIAGEDRKFVWADAAIDGDSVVLSSAEVSSPVAARYGWANNPVCNLYNSEGLPASPFRTDDWPGVTYSER